MIFASTGEAIPKINANMVKLENSAQAIFLILKEGSIVYNFISTTRIRVIVPGYFEKFFSRQVVHSIEKISILNIYFNHY